MSAITINNVPAHIAIIMDGNGRWAKQRGLPRLKGHEAGAAAVRRVIRYCRERGVRYLTLYAFSTENWARPPSEVLGLMNLLRRFLRDNEAELHAHQVRLRVIGRRGDLDAAVLRALARVERATAAYSRGELILALSYSGRSELVDASRAIAAAAVAGALRPDAIDEATIRAHLYAPDVPDPDLIVRTSGEMRLSNFLLWQASYSELYVTPVLWPDFGEDDFVAALRAYAQRQRRFGRVAVAAGGSVMTLLYRLISGVGIAAAWALGMRYLPGWALFAAFLVCALLCQWEFYRLTERGGHTICRGRGLVMGALWLTAVFAVPTSPRYVGHVSLEHYVGALVLVGGGMLLFLHLLFNPRVARPIDTAAVTLLGFFYVPFLLSYYIRLAQWDASGFLSLSRGGLFMAFYVALVVKLSDVGAYTAGRLWGRHKLFPRISPGKSWEGLAGGMTLAVVASAVLIAVAHRWRAIPVTPLSGLNLTTAVLLGLLLGLIGVLGDLVESMFKRCVQAKDSSAIVPGMGGLLDVFDSLVFAPAIFYLLLPWMSPL